MEYEFCVENDHDARAFEALAAAEFRLYRQRRGGLLWCAAVGVPVFLLSLIWKGTGSPGPTWCLRVLAAVFAAALVLPVRWRRELRLRDARARALEEAEQNWEYGLEYAFFDTYFKVWGHEGTRIVYYGAVTDLVETADYFLIFLDGANAHAIRKADFTRGDPVRFAAFLSGACARPWEQMAV